MYMYSDINNYRLMFIALWDGRTNDCSYHDGIPLNFFVYYILKLAIC